ncbi:hypothetical protein N7520_002630 [Penicillium odoratum]|uniref:uncharacterized protein n=1 Tax=Penicillium odoratum TaxID=1167516 RepID=UPI0025482912|nr:uncharacterized protein N7520_002630 [Penicillium odoratum]KAJ5772101.1 hypothetical protein N7520_002630 [Penicillium odoratum]
MPVSHLTLTVSHLPTSTSFFLSCLQPLGYQFIGRHDDYIGFGQKQGEPADFWVTERKPGGPPSAVHVAFPAPSRDAVGSFFISALKAGGTIHNEPKCRDSQTGFFSAAVIDLDGNSIEAVYRTGGSVVASEAGPTIALLENGSVVSKASKSSRATSVRSESIATPRSEAKSRAVTAVSRAPTSVAPSSIAPTAYERESTYERERYAPSAVSRPSQPAPPTYTVQTVQTVQKPVDDGSKAAKTIIGTLIGAAAGAAIAYAMVKGDSESSSDANTSNPSPQYTPEHHQLMGPPSQVSQSEGQRYRALEGPSTRSVYTAASAPRSTLSRSQTSKNPRASTIYEGTEFFDDHGRGASDGSVFSIPEHGPLRAIEYPASHNEWRDEYSPSTFISSYAADKPRAGSVHSVSTIKASQANGQRRHSHDDRDTYSTHSNGSKAHRAASSHGHSHHSTKSVKDNGSVASSIRSARNIPLPAGSKATYYSATPSEHGKSHLSARNVPLPDSVIDLDVNSHVSPNDSVSQIGSRPARSSHSHHSKHSKSSKHSSKPKFEDVVKPADSVSQVSRTSQRTIKAEENRAASRVSSWRSQVV